MYLKYQPYYGKERKGNEKDSEGKGMKRASKEKKGGKGNEKKGKETKRKGQGRKGKERYGGKHERKIKNTE